VLDARDVLGELRFVAVGVAAVAWEAGNVLDEEILGRFGKRRWFPGLPSDLFWIKACGSFDAEKLLSIDGSSYGVCCCSNVPIDCVIDKMLA
jgi:hypothetical protein